MLDFQRKQLNEIQERWIQDDVNNLSVFRAALDIGMLISIIESLDVVRPEGEVMSTHASRETIICRRGTVYADSQGQPFEHEIVQATGVCVFCGYGKKPAPPEAIEKRPTTDRIETVMCAEHGSHTLTVHPDGSYTKPDCRMFGVINEPTE